MSLDSQIYFQTDASPAEVQLLLEQRTPFASVDDVNEYKEMVAGASVLGIRSADPNEVWINELSIRPNMAIFNTCIDTSSTPLWKLDTLRVAIALLHAYPGDLMFIYFDITPVMRKDGYVFLKIDDDFWKARGEFDPLALVDLPYEWGHNPMP